MLFNWFKSYGGVVPVLGALGSILGPVSSLLGGGQQQAPQAPQVPVAPADDSAKIEAEEASKLRALKRRQANTQNLFRVEEEDSDTLLGG